MKVTFLTLGSRGDVQPYVALAKELKKNGHEALVCTGATFKKFIQENGVGFHEATADLMAILESEEGRKVFNGGSYKIFKILRYAKKVITPAYRKSMDDFLDASKGSDIIIYHPKALAAVDIAEYLNIPCICMPPVPILYPITEFPNFAISANKNFGSFLNKLTYKANSLGEASYMKHINDFRNKSLHIQKRKAGELAFKEKLVRALKETNNRAVVLIGVSGMSFENEENILAVEKVPHRLIFAKAKGIVHHGGVGTMSEALLSGVPQQVIPFTVDQPFWAYRLYSKGYAMLPLREKTLETTDLVKAFKEMENDKYIKNAKDIKNIIESEKGLENAVKYIETVYKSF